MHKMTLPQGKLSKKHILYFVMKQMNKTQHLIFILAGPLILILGMVYPYAYKILFSKVVDQGDRSVFLGVSILLITATVAAMLLMCFKEFYVMKLDNQIRFGAKYAIMERMLSMPAIFMTKYNSGEINEFMSAAERVCVLTSKAVFFSGLTGIFSLVFYLQIVILAPDFIWITVLVSCFQFISILLTAYLQRRQQVRKNQSSIRLSKAEAAYLMNIQKIKTFHSEETIHARWLKLYKKYADDSFKPGIWLKLYPVLNALIYAVGFLTAYRTAAALASPVSVFMAYLSAHGMSVAAIASIAVILTGSVERKTAYKMAQPFLEQATDLEFYNKVQQNPNRYHDMIILNHITFRYQEGVPLLKDINLKIAPGEMIGISGETGMGKTTILKLLTGIIKPEKGEIYIGDTKLESESLYNIREKIGVIFQNSRLFYGDILHNLTVASDDLSEQEAYWLLDLVLLADDIISMPMGIHTAVSEAGNTLSGGQKQKLLLARAFAKKPQILILDEATTCIDEESEDLILKRIKELHYTCIIVSHKASALRHCSRRFVLADGILTEE